MGRQDDILAEEQEPILFEDADYFLPYPKQELRLELHSGEKREQLKQSIINNGVIEPIIAMPSREQRGKLVIIAGHNRADICKELGVKVPYRLRVDINEDEADLLCIETNLLQRQLDEIKISQLAFILKARRDALSHQGKASGQTVQKSEEEENTLTSDVLGLEYKLSGRQIRRYISLTNLIPNFLSELDCGHLQKTAGYTLSVLSQENQEILYSYLVINDLKCNPNNAIEIKDKCDFGAILTTEMLDSIFKTKSERVKNNISFKKNELKKYIPDSDWHNAKEIVIHALKAYYQI